MKHAPCRGTQPAIVDMMGGQAAAVSGPVGEFLQHLPTGKVRLLATSGATRSRFSSDVATSPAELASTLKRDNTRWGPLIKAIGFTADS